MLIYAILCMAIARVTMVLHIITHWYVILSTNLFFMWVDYYGVLSGQMLLSLSHMD